MIFFCGFRPRQDDRRRRFLRLAGGYGRDIIGDRLFLVDPKMTSKGANKSFIKDASGELIELLFFKRAQESRTDLSRGRDIVQLNLALLAFSF